MMTDTQIQEKLVAQFSFLSGVVTMPRPRRLFVTVELTRFTEVFTYAVKELGCTHLISITGFDDGDILSFMYHLAHENGTMLNIKTSAPKTNPVIMSVTNLFPGADIYERELVDLFGAVVRGLASGHRYPLTDDWPKDQYPLRKDWKPAEAEKGGQSHA